MTALGSATVAGARIQLLSVNVGLPAVIGERMGEPVVSGIRKRPVTPGGVRGETIVVGRTNLAGDGQADLRVHGGPDKAIYAYPSEHLPWWNEELGPETLVGPGTFGENLTTAGIDETTARIGDRWRWGTALLEISQPRFPCYKLGLATARPDILKRFLAAGRSGWYLRVVEPGVAPLAGPICIVSVDAAGVTIMEAARAALPDADGVTTARVLASPALAPAWREMVSRG